MRRGCKRSRPRRGLFALPRVPGAKKVAKAKRRDVSWLARTTPDTGLVEFSEAFDRLTPEGKRYIVAHEQAHLEAGADHDAKFYEVLKKLTKERRIDWETAWGLETFNLPRGRRGYERVARAMCPHGRGSCTI